MGVSHIYGFGNEQVGAQLRLSRANVHATQQKHWKLSSHGDADTIPTHRLSDVLHGRQVPRNCGAGMALATSFHPYWRHLEHGGVSFGRYDVSVPVSARVYLLYLVWDAPAWSFIENLISVELKENFYYKLKGFISHIVHQQNLIMDMGSTCPKLFSGCLSLNKAFNRFKEELLPTAPSHPNQVTGFRSAARVVGVLTCLASIHPPQCGDFSLYWRDESSTLQTVGPVMAAGAGLHDWHW